MALGIIAVLKVRVFGGLQCIDFKNHAPGGQVASWILDVGVSQN